AGRGSVSCGGSSSWRARTVSSNGWLLISAWTSTFCRMFCQKSLRPDRQREIARYVQSSYAVSERRSCAILPFDRRSIRYRSVRADQTPLLMRIRDIAQTRMRYGYFRIYILLRREGWVVNHKRVYRLYREDGLSLRLKRPSITVAHCMKL